MHELAIAGHIVEIASRHADGRRVTKVHLKVGHLRQVVPSALAFSFGLVAEGTLVDGAALDLEEIPAAGRCRTCNTQTLLREFPLRCEACGGLNLEITQGEELYVESLEIEDQQADEKLTADG